MAKIKTNKNEIRRESEDAAPVTPEQHPPPKPSIERAILTEYFNSNWITVLWKAGGAVFGFIVFGFGVGYHFGSQSEKKVIEKIEHTNIIRDTVVLNNEGKRVEITLDSLLKKREK